MTHESATATQAPEIETYEHWREADRRALKMMQLIVTKIDADPSLIQIAIDNLQRWREQGDGYQPLGLQMWEKWFAQEVPWKEIREWLLEDSDEGQRLRTSHPFAGVLTSEERESVYDFDWPALKAQYEQQTGKPWPTSTDMVIEQFGTPNP